MEAHGKYPLYAPIESRADCREMIAYSVVGRHILLKGSFLSFTEGICFTPKCTTGKPNLPKHFKKKKKNISQGRIEPGFITLWSWHLSGWLCHFDMAEAVWILKRSFLWLTDGDHPHQNALQESQLSLTMIIGWNERWLKSVAFSGQKPMPSKAQSQNPNC